MSQELFEEQHKATWAQFEAMVKELEAFKPAIGNKKYQIFPKAYRQICKHLSLAQSRCYSTHIVERLNLLVLKGHDILYKDRNLLLSRIATFFTTTFPMAVRRERLLFVVCLLTFVGPGLSMYFAVRMDSDLAYTLVPEEVMMSYVEMHDPQYQTGRTVADDFNMFGHYILNNVGINFRTFTSGFLFCLGTLFSLIYNGLYFGCIAGYIDQSESSSNFYAFVVGHSAFELTALVLAGVAGMRFGAALLFPGNLSRRQALRQAARSGLVILYGAAAMTFLAAVVEAFWSPRHIPFFYKHMAGLFAWVLTIVYLLFMGRHHES